MRRGAVQLPCLGLDAASPRQLELFSTAPSAPAPKPAPSAPRPPPREELIVKADLLARRLAAQAGAPVRLAVTDNRSTMVSFRRRPGALSVRLHHMFLEAPDEVVLAVADYAVRGRRQAGKVLDAFIRSQQRVVPPRARKPGELQPLGKCHDLQELFDGLNQRFFQGGVQARIGWGRAWARRRRRSIRLGVYDHQAREIRIHAALDQPDVPRFFVEYIVFHEMLHQLFPGPKKAGRQVHHPPAFKDREKAYPHYAAALAWEKEHLDKLLRRVGPRKKRGQATFTEEGNAELGRATF